MKLVKEVTHEELLKKGQKGGSLRYYELDFNIFKGLNGWRICDIMEVARKRLRPEYEMVEPDLLFTKFICVSDAHSHIERLVFPAFWVRKIETGEIILSHTHTQIAGVWTNKSEGGDESTIEEPEYYVKQLRNVEGNF